MRPPGGAPTEPYAREAREFLRKLCIGAAVGGSLEFTRTIPPSLDPERSQQPVELQLGNAFISTPRGPQQLAEALVRRGYATVQVSLSRKASGNLSRVCSPLLCNLLLVIFIGTCTQELLKLLSRKGLHLEPEQVWPVFRGFICGMALLDHSVLIFLGCIIFPGVCESVVAVPLLRRTAQVLQRMLRNMTHALQTMLRGTTQVLEKVCSGESRL